MTTVPYRVKIYRGAFDDPNRQQVFSQDIDFASSAGSSIAYDPSAGQIYSHTFSQLQLSGSGSYSIQFDYLRTAEMRANSAYVRAATFGPDTYSYGAGYAPTSFADNAIDSSAAYINGASQGASSGDIPLSFTYSSLQGGSIVICFLKGTQIGVLHGSSTVEALSVNQELESQDQPARVKWIGYQRRTPEFAQFDDYLPVKICAGALEEDIPIRDLYLSPDHAILVDGHLIHAQALVNGRTIIKMTEWQGDIEYYHIETENHEIIFAEGVPCETFIDNVSREQFDNYAEYKKLNPDPPVIKEMPLPRVLFKNQLPSAIRKRLDARTELLRSLAK
jgi:hypothetical protein